MEKVNAAVIGAGVVGLAVAESISRKIKGEVVVLERNEKFGRETSSRNSEVIHAGIYYPKNSLKSRLCLRGNAMLYEFCRAQGVRHRKCGKLIVSTNEEEAERIGSIYQAAVAIGVPDLSLLSRQGVAGFESGVTALNGIFSGSTGIIDSHGLMERLYLKAVGQGAVFAFGCEVASVAKAFDQVPGYLISCGNGEEIFAEKVINCAGLSSDRIAASVGLDSDGLGYKLHYCKGDYFSLSGSLDKLDHLVYPVPPSAGHGLGIHATIDLAGQIRLGPDATYIDQISYDVETGKKTAFYESAKRFLPRLEEKMLSPDTAGIRPKLQGLNDGFRDFVIKEETDNGYPGLVNLVGIESPGLTAALAIAEFVAQLK